MALSKKLDIAVVGIGTAGAASAVLLAQRGHKVTVFERVEKPTHIGAGIMLQPTGISVLAHMGLHEEVVHRAAPIERLVARNRRGRSVLDLSYAALDVPGIAHRCGFGTHRGVLFRALSKACGEHATIRTGVEIVDVRPMRRGKREILDAHGQSHGAYDLVIASDGARSTLRRRQHEIPWRSVPYPWGALWVIRKDPDRLFKDRLFQVLDGTSHMVGLLPTGLGPDHDTPLVSLFISVALTDVPRIRAEGLDALRDRVVDLCPETIPVFDRVESLDNFTTAEYHDVVMPRWHADGLVFLGDAAHATSPQLGQGCNLALCDGWTLAHAIDTTSELNHALTRYSEQRSRHLDFYQPVTRWVTPFFQSHYEPLAWIRDIFMGPAGKIPFVEREMVRTMAGMKAGFLWGAFEAPAQLSV